MDNHVHAQAVSTACTHSTQRQSWARIPVPQFYYYMINSRKPSKLRIHTLFIKIYRTQITITKIIYFEGHLLIHQVDTNWTIVMELFYFLSKFINLEAFKPIEFWFIHVLWCIDHNSWSIPDLLKSSSHGLTMNHLIFKLESRSPNYIFDPSSFRPSFSNLFFPLSHLMFTQRKLYHP